MIRDRKVEAISTTVALNAECACEGRSIPRARFQRASGLQFVPVLEVSVTAVDFTGQAGRLTYDALNIQHFPSLTRALDAVFLGAS
jgi:hypothetical protein